MKVNSNYTYCLLLLRPLLLFVCSLAPPELYAAGSREFSGDFVQSKLAVIPEDISELITLPGDIVFCFTAKELAQFSLDTTDHEVNMNIDSTINDMSNTQKFPSPPCSHVVVRDKGVPTNAICLLHVFVQGNIQNIIKFLVQFRQCMNLPYHK